MSNSRATRLEIRDLGGLDRDVVSASAAISHRPTRQLSRFAKLLFCTRKQIGAHDRREPGVARGRGTFTEMDRRQWRIKSCRATSSARASAWRSRVSRVRTARALRWSSCGGTDRCDPSIVMRCLPVKYGLALGAHFDLMAFDGLRSRRCSRTGSARLWSRRPGAYWASRQSSRSVAWSSGTTDSRQIYRDDRIGTLGVTGRLQYRGVHSIREERHDVLAQTVVALALGLTARRSGSRPAPSPRRLRNVRVRRTLRDEYRPGAGADALLSAESGGSGAQACYPRRVVEAGHGRCRGRAQRGERAGATVLVVGSLLANRGHSRGIRMINAATGEPIAVVRGDPNLAKREQWRRRSRSRRSSGAQQVEGGARRRSARQRAGRGLVHFGRGLRFGTQVTGPRRQSRSVAAARSAPGFTEASAALQRVAADHIATTHAATRVPSRAHDLKFHCPPSAAQPQAPPPRLSRGSLNAAAPDDTRPGAAAFRRQNSGMTSTASGESRQHIRLSALNTMVGTQPEEATRSRRYRREPATLLRRSGRDAPAPGASEALMRRRCQGPRAELPPPFGRDRFDAERIHRDSAISSLTAAPAHHRRPAPSSRGVAPDLGRRNTPPTGRSLIGASSLP